MKKHFLYVILVFALFFCFSSTSVLAATTKKTTTKGTTSTVSTSSTTTTTKKTTTTTKKFCPYNIRVNLKEDASKINVAYSFRTGSDGVVDGFKIIVHNLPKTMYMNIANKVNNNKLYVRYVDTGNEDIKYYCNSTPIDSNEKEKIKNLKNNGTFVFNVCEITKVVKYTITVRASKMALQEYINEVWHDEYYDKFLTSNYDKYHKQMMTKYNNDEAMAEQKTQEMIEKDTQNEISLIADACSNGDIRNLSVTTPKRNEFYDTIPYCKDKELEDSYYCKEWINYNFKITREEAMERLLESKKRRADESEDYYVNDKDALYDFFVKYGLIIVLVIALLVVLDIIFILYNLWRRKEKSKL